MGPIPGQQQRKSRFCATCWHAFRNIGRASTQFGRRLSLLATRSSDSSNYLPQVLSLRRRTWPLPLRPSRSKARRKVHAAGSELSHWTTAATPPFFVRANPVFKPSTEPGSHFLTEQN